MLLTNGRIYTLNARGTIADTLVVRDGRWRSPAGVPTSMPRQAKTSSTSAGAPRCPGSSTRTAT